MAFLPRDVINWLDTLDLAYSVRNVRRDLSNGFVIAEILTRRFPKEINIYTFDNGLKIDKKIDNWEQISKLLKKKDFILTKEEYEPIIYYAPDAAMNFLKRLYEFLLGKKFPEPLKKPLPEPKPHFAKPTAAMLSRDRELVRIVNKDLQKAKTIFTLTNHLEQKKIEHRTLNISKYIIDKKRREQAKKLLEEQNRLRAMGALKSISINQNLQNQEALEVKELVLKSLNSSTTKKTKEAPTLIMEAKGVIEYLNDISKDLIEGPNGLTKTGKLTIPSDLKMSAIQYVFSQGKEINSDDMDALIHLCKDNVSGVVERVNNNFSDFKKFFMLMDIPLQNLHWKSTAFLNLVEFIKSIGIELLSHDTATTETMFESITLNRLIDIVLIYPNKREAICSIIYSFIGNESSSRYRILTKIKSRLTNKLSIYVSLLAIFVTFDYKEDFSDELYHTFFFYSMMALDFPSPISRTNGLKVLSEILHINFVPVLQIINKLQILALDDWWEVKAMILIICSMLLQYIARNKESLFLRNNFIPHSPVTSKPEQADNTEEHIDIDGNFQNVIPEVQGEELQDMAEINDEIKAIPYENEENYLLNLLNNIFTTNTNQNILKIGLIYMAPVLYKYPNLCARYLEVLLSVTDDIRAPVLDINPIPGGEEGYIVLGSNSFKYKLTGAPNLWNSVGIAEALEKYVQQKSLENFEKEHIEILAGCLVQPLEPKDSEIWLRIYESLKSYIFIGLCDRELCQLCAEVLKKFLTFETIQVELLRNSKKIFEKTLVLLYHPDRELTCKENLLDLFDYLQNLGNDRFKEYNYEIIKEFSEKNRNKFLQSNLVNFMNSIAKERRVKMFSSTILN